MSGCFQLLSCDVIDDVGGFDERFFMYMEDLDDDAFYIRRKEAINNMDIDIDEKRQKLD